MMDKVYVVMVSGYYNEEYWDVYSHIDSVYSTKEKAESYIKSIDDIRYDDEIETWIVGNEDVDAYGVRFYEIEEVAVE